MKTDATVADRLKVFVGSACWLGLFPIAPGTCAAVLGVVIHVLVVLLAPSGWRLPLLIGALLLTCAVNAVLTPWAQKYFNSLDPKNFVLDEVAGYLVVPILFAEQNLWVAAPAGFLLFRIFDIIKVPPARGIDRNTHGAWGIVLDDLIAGAYAALVLHLVRWLGLYAAL